MGQFVLDFHRDSWRNLRTFGRMNVVPSSHRCDSYLSACMPWRLQLIADAEFFVGSCYCGDGGSTKGLVRDIESPLEGIVRDWAYRVRQ